jgi:hypothetical protein
LFSEGVTEARTHTRANQAKQSSIARLSFALLTARAKFKYDPFVPTLSFIQIGRHERLLLPLLEVKVESKAD